MNKKLIIVIMMLLLIITGCNKKEDGKKEEKEAPYFKNYNVETLATLNNCSSQDCQVSPKSVYAKISAQTNIKELEDVINKQNEAQEKLYKKAKESIITKDTKCNLKINYSFGINTNYFTYSDDELVTVGDTTIEYYYCEGKIVTSQVNYYVYDLKEERMLTQEEYLKKVGINLSDVVKNINAYQQLNNEDFRITEDADIVVYRTDWGEYFASYYNSNSKSYETLLLGKGAQ